MGIGSTLTKGVRRTGKNNKAQLEFPSSDSSKTNSSIRKGSKQGDSDSEATSFSSSVHGSTSSATSSFDRYSSGAGGHHQKKALEKLNSKKPSAFGSIRPSRRRPQSQLTSLQDDDPATTHHPFLVEPSGASPDHQASSDDSNYVIKTHKALGPPYHLASKAYFRKHLPKFTRSGSLRSLRIVRKKNISSSESKKSSTVQDSHSKKATFSSILKDSKFPKQVEPQVCVKESEEVISAAELCPYEHCSLHAHHHHHQDPPIKRFSFLKRRPSKDQKSINPQTRETDKRSVKKKEVKKVSNERGKKKDVDFSIEFYAKTRPDLSFEQNSSRDDLHLAEIMFGVNGDEQNEIGNLQMDHQDRLIVNIDGETDSLDGFADVESKKPGLKSDNQISMWRLIHRHMVSGLMDEQLQEEKQSCFDDDDAVNKGKEIQKMLAIKMVRDAIEKILLPEEDGSEKNQVDDENDVNKAANDALGTRKDQPNRWNYVKKVILMRRFITELENEKKKLDPHKRAQVPLVPDPEPEAEIVSLKSQMTRAMKNSNEWMLDYALQQVVAELAPTQKRKVALLVKSFEMITPKLEEEVAV